MSEGTPRDAPWDEGRVVWIALGITMLAGALVFWLFEALPFQDLPAHAGILAMRHRYAESAFEQRYYKLGSSIGPYSLFLWLGELFDAGLGPLGATRALGTLPVLTTPLALLFARRRLQQDRSVWAGFLGVALSFGFMTILGLASYLLALALLVVAFTVWLELLADLDAGQPTARREALFAGLALLAALAHGHALAVLALFAVTTSMAGARDSRWRRVARLRALVPALAPMIWSVYEGGPPPGSSASFVLVPSANYQTVADKLSLLLTPTLMTRTGIDLAVGIAVWVVLVGAVVATLGDPTPPSGDAERRSRAHSRALAFALVSLAASFFALPHAFEWFGFIDGRMVLPFLYVAILLVRRPALGPRLDRALLVLAKAAAVLMTTLALVASARFQAEARGSREVLGAIPPEASVLNLPIDPDSDVFTAHPFVHYDKLAAIDEPVLLSDVWPDRGTTLYPTPDNPQVRLPDSYNSANLKRIDWPSYDLTAFSHVLIRTRPDAAPPPTPPGVLLVKHAGGFWLYRTRASP
jgi:hypothetical protein